MENLEKYLSKLAKHIKHLKYEQFITGEKAHPRLAAGKFIMPDYAKKFREVTEIFEIACLVKGKCVINMNDTGYVLKPGDFCLIKYGTKHFESYYKKNMNYEIIWFLPSPVETKIIESEYFLGNFKIKSSLTIKAKKEITGLLEKIFYIDDKKKQFKKLRSIFEEWFSLLLPALKAKNLNKRFYSEEYARELTVNSKKIERSMDFIRKFYKENIKLTDIAKQSDISPNYFCALFRKAYNQTLKAFIIELRLREATSLLRSTALDINEIALSAGYSDPYYFSRLFKKYIGFSPTDFRKKISKPKTTFSPHIIE